MYEVVGYRKNSAPEQPKGGYEVIGYSQKTPETPSQESGIMSYLKDIPGIASSALLGAASVPANIAQVGREALQYFGGNAKPSLPERLMNQLTPEQKAKVEQIQQQEPQKESPLHGAVRELRELAPQAKTGLGKEVAEAAETLGAMLFPIPGLGAANIGKAAKLSGVGQLAKFASKQIGLSEDTADKVKLGTMLFTGILGRGGPKKEAVRIYEDLKDKAANAFVPRDDIVKISDKVMNEFTRKGLAEAHSGKKALNEVADRLSLLGEYGPKVSVSDIIDFKRDLGDKARELAKYGKRTEHIVRKMGSDLNDLLKKSPSVPKEIADALSQADSLYAGSKNMANVFQTIKNLPMVGKIAAPTTLALLGFYSPEKAIKLAGIGAALAGGGALAEIAKSPTLQKHYANIIASAAKDLKGPTLKHIKRFDQELQKKL